MGYCQLHRVKYPPCLSIHAMQDSQPPSLIQEVMNLVLGSLLVDIGLGLWVICQHNVVFREDLAVHTLWLVSSILSPTASLAAVARLPREASLSFATCLLASLLAVALEPWTVSET